MDCPIFSILAILLPPLTFVFVAAVDFHLPATATFPLYSHLRRRSIVGLRWSGMWMAMVGWMFSMRADLPLPLTLQRSTLKMLHQSLSTSTMAQRFLLASFLDCNMVL